MLHLWNKRFNYSALKRVTDKSGARHYSLDGNKVPSVTTILEKTKAQKDIDSLNAWRDRVGQVEATRIINESTSRGDKMHKNLEDALHGKQSLNFEFSDDIEKISKANDMTKVLDSLKLTQDTQRLESRKSRSGQSRLRGRSKKVGKSVLFVTKDSSEVSKAIGALPGVEVKNVKDLSVLDLAPGSHPIRLTVYSKSAIEEIAKIKSTHLEVMVKTQ